MNKRTKIITDRKLPDSNEIAKHGDFNSIMNNYTLTKKLLVQKILAWSAAGIGTASVIAGIIYYSTKNAPAPVAENKIVKTELAYVQPPLPGTNVESIEKTVNAVLGGTMTYPSGSSVQVPADAFVFEDGSPVTGEVSLKFREFKNIKDIFVSGIPMNYDSAGTHFNLESADMIELTGFSAGKRVKLKPGKNISINLPSDYAENNYNLYRLDTVKKNWVCYGKDSMNKIMPAKEKRSSSIEPKTEPALKPKLADKTKYQFHTSIDEKQFPELAAYDSIKFEVTDNSFSSKLYRVHWDKITLQEGTTKGNYIALLKKKDTTLTVNVIPVFKEKDYQAALSQFNKKLEEAKKNMELKSKERDNKMASLAKESPMITNRIMVINQLGIWNSDRPMPPMPNVLVLNLGNMLIDKDNNPIECENFYVAEKNKNTVFSYPKGTGVQINTKAKNLVWTVSDKGKIVFVDLGDYLKLYKGKQDKMKVYAEDNKETALAKIDEFSKEKQ